MFDHQINSVNKYSYIILIPVYPLQNAFDKINANTANRKIDFNLWYPRYRKLKQQNIALNIYSIGYIYYCFVGMYCDEFVWRFEYIQLN